MPTRPLRRPIKPTPSSVTKSGSKKVLVILIVIVLAVLIGLYFLLSRNPSKPTAESAGSATNDSGQTGPDEVSGVAKSSEVAMSRAKLQLESTGSKDIVRVIIDKAAGDGGGEITYKFNWTLNGQPAGVGSDSLDGFKRGDRVAVKITPYQGEKSGSSRILDFIVNNTPPRFAESQEMKFDGKTFSYQVKATDQDSDALSYTLEEAPEGMVIDPQTGAIRWQLRESDYGARTIKVKVNDGKGGIATESIKLDLPKPSEEKKSGDNQK
jgi:hypothetical protein